MAVAFDVLEYSRRLKVAGVPGEQAEAQAEALAQVVAEALVTRQDVRELEHRLTVRLGAMLTIAAGAVATLAKLF